MNTAVRKSTVQTAVFERSSELNVLSILVKTGTAAGVDKLRPFEPPC